MSIWADACAESIGTSRSIHNRSRFISESFLQFGNGEEIGLHLHVEPLVVHADDGIMSRLYVLHLHEVHRQETLHLVDVGDGEPAV